jgi:O-antigen/teichoic acid export membrane protein
MTSSNPKRALLAGAAWAVAMRWSVRLLGLFNTLIMARLVLPSDYGVVAMAMLVVGLVQTMLDTGTSTAIQRKEKVTRDDLDSAWTLRLIEFLIVAAILAISAYPASLYFQEPRVVPVILIIAMGIAVQSVFNIGNVLAQREFNFSIDFKINVIGKFVGVTFTIIGGVIFGDYRALVMGIASSYLISTVLSYVLHPYRASWNTSRIAEIWNVTKWLMFAGLASFTLRKGDEVIASRLAGAQEFGLYNVSSDLGQMPTGEVGPAILRSFLPVLSSIQSDAKRTNSAVVKTVAAVNTITVPIGVLFATLAAPVTLLLLGAQWQGATRLVGIFAILSTFQIMLAPLGTLLTLRGYTKTQSHIVWAEFVCFLIGAAAWVPSHGIVGLALARLASTVFNASLTAGFAKYLCGLRLRELLHALYRPWLGALLSALVAFEAVGYFTLPWLQVLIAGGLGLLTYVIWCAGTWILAGRPEGLESTVADHWVAWRDSRSA